MSHTAAGRRGDRRAAPPARPDGDHRLRAPLRPRARPPRRRTGRVRPTTPTPSRTTGSTSADSTGSSSTCWTCTPVRRLPAPRHDAEHRPRRRRRRHAESYFLSVIRVDGAEKLRLTAGRYVDRLERRDREWRIADRVVVLEWYGSMPGGGDRSGDADRAAPRPRRRVVRPPAARDPATAAARRQLTGAPVRATVSRTSRSEERQHDALELVLALDHRPVPAVGKMCTSQWGMMRIGTSALSSGRHPVVAAQGEQRRRLDLGEHRRPGRPTLRAANCASPSSILRLNIRRTSSSAPGAVAASHRSSTNSSVRIAGVVDHRLHPRHEPLARRVLDELDEQLDALRRARAEQRDADAADRDQAADAVRMRRGDPGRDVAAHRVAEDRNASSASASRKSSDRTGSGQHRICLARVALAEARAGRARACGSARRTRAGCRGSSPSR